MKKGPIRHPFGDVIYQLTADGHVEVTDGDRKGLFTKRGEWVSGDLREADPQMCVWVTNVHEPNEVIDPKRQGAGR
ncbi:MAG: hypothetical protein ACR2PZ_23285 [Pseudomonadales bacterium]